MYTYSEILQVLYNTFNHAAESVEYVGFNTGKYLYNVYPDASTTLGTLSQMAQELYDSDLFDITMNNDHLHVEYLNPDVLERKQFHILYESITHSITFTDDQITEIKKKFNRVNLKYHHNNFFISIMKQLEDKKKLTRKQLDELEFLLKNGQTRYEAGVLSTKN